MKGVSPVVATVLMVAVAIAAAVVAYSWFMSMQASVQAEASRGASNVGKEQLAIASVYCGSGSDNNLYVVIRDIGDEKISGDFSIYVKDAATSEVNASTVCSGITVPAKDSTKIALGTCNPPVACNSLPDNIIVEVHAPGGAVVSTQQRIR